VKKEEAIDNASISAQIMQVNIIRNFEQYDAFIEKYELREFGNLNESLFLKRYFLDFNSFLELFGAHPHICDPFSEEYAKWEMAFFEFLSGKPYSFDSEGLDAPADIRSIPTIFRDMDTRIRQLQIYADLLDKIRPKQGERVLEMGCGWGYLLELFGRCGCRISGIDVSKNFVEYTANLLSVQNIDANILCGTFYDIDSFDEKFDLVIFDKSFHHCGEPFRLLEIVRKKTSPGCRVLFVNEPIMMYADRPWGIIRYDGETILQIRRRGWLELGYRVDFFKELLITTGFQLSNTYSMCDGNILYEATPG
jgi:hypothetical protein